MSDETVASSGDGMALRCLSCGARTEIIAGPRTLSDKINELEALIWELGTDPNPEGRAPEDMVAYHHAKAWDWATIANTAAEEVRELKADRVQQQAEIDRLNAVVKEQGEKLTSLRNALEVAEVQAATLPPRSYEDHRVLDMTTALPVAALRWLSHNAPSDPAAADALRTFVAVELSRRIAHADLDLPYHVSTAQLRETSHAQLFEELERAIEEGERARQMTPEQREERFQARVTARGYR